MKKRALVSGFDLGSYEEWFASEFDMTVYSLDHDKSNIGSSELDIKNIPTTNIPLIGESIQPLLDRLSFSFWTPPVEHDVILTMWAPTNTVRHRPEQSRIHLMIGIHRGFFALGHRDDFSNISLVEVMEKLNRLFFRSQDKSALESVDVLVMESNFVANMADHYYNITPDVIIPPPTDTSSFYTDRPADEEFYLYLGRLAEEKGVENIVQAFNNLPYRLVIAGSGPKRSAIETTANNNIDLRGYVSENEKKDLFAKCTGFIQNTIGEPFGNTVVEAMASGAPVIAVNDGNNPHLIEDGTTGVLFDRRTPGSYQRPESPEPLIEAVQRSRKIDWDHQKIIRSSEEYDIDRVKKKWSKLFNQFNDE
jgi:glycosyltransferase involved in cell wall biosynthesis